MNRRDTYWAKTRKDNESFNKEAVITTPDYKYGEYDAKILALKEDVAELKSVNTCQHDDIIDQIRELTKVIDGLRGDMGIMKGKSSAYGAVAGFLTGMIIPLINLFKNN